MLVSLLLISVESAAGLFTPSLDSLLSGLIVRENDR